MFSLPFAQVVGDLAQFMVQNELTEQELVDRAETLDFPSRCFPLLAAPLLSVIASACPSRTSTVVRNPAAGSVV